MISSPDNEILFSAASAWELGLKVARGKLRLPDAYADCLLGDGVTELPVSIAHAVRAMRLPVIHGDPFDRLLVAQALEDDLVLVTADQVVCSYPVPIQKA